MQIAVQKYLKRITDVNAWLEENKTALTVVPRFAALKTALTDQQHEVETRGTAFIGKVGDASSNVTLKEELLDAVRQDISAIVRAAHAIDLTQPGFVAHFQRAASKGDEAVIGTARAFLDQLKDTDILAAFLEIGMPADLKVDLAADIEHFDDYESRISTLEQAHILDLMALNDAISASSRTIATLDAIIHFIFADDKNLLSSWKLAKRLEKMRAHRQLAETDPQPPTS